MVKRVGPATTKTYFDYLSFPPPYDQFDRWIDHRTRWRQGYPAQPVDFPYHRQVGWSEYTGAGSPTSASLIASVYGTATPAVDWAKGKAWDKFVDKATPNASLGETLGEMHSSGAMVLQRILQFSAFVKHLNRFEFVKAADVLGLPRRNWRDVWSRDRTVAQMIMEVQYGWRPLIRDMQNAMKVLTRDFSDVKAKGRAWDYDTFKYVAPPYSANVSIYWLARVQYTARIRVSNPNLALFSALGVTNILGTALALTPYSFVLDWFSNLSQSIAGYNRFMGLTIIRPTTSVKVQVLYGNVWNNYGWTTDVEVVTFDRTLALKIPGFYLKPLRGWSPERALNAISLLILQLPKRPEDRVATASRQPLPFNWDSGRKVPGWKVPR